MTTELGIGIGYLAVGFAVAVRVRYVGLGLNKSPDGTITFFRFIGWPAAVFLDYAVLGYGVFGVARHLERGPVERTARWLRERRERG